MSDGVKGLIVEKFEELARAKPIDRITVTELVKACGISRQTFYYHYQDMLDVVETALRCAMDELQARCRAAATLEEALRLWLSLSLDSGSLLRRLVNTRHPERIHEMLQCTVHACFQGMLRALAPWPGLPDDDQETALSFCTYGMVGVLIDASRTQHPDVDRLAQQLRRLLSAGLHAPPACP